ncbi:MAG: DUF3078 domain-containing protein [Bacteroidota bacterium]
MVSGISKNFALLLLSFIFVNAGFSQNNSSNDEEKQALEFGIDLLKRYFGEERYWYVTQGETGESVRGLVNFIEKEPIDTILFRLEDALNDTSSLFVYRLPEHVPDSLNLPGYYPAAALQNDIDSLWENLRQKYIEEDITVPLQLVSEIEEKAGAIPAGESEKLFSDGTYAFPDSLQLPDVIPDSLMESPDDFARILRLDSLRNRYMEQIRKEYNDSVIWAYRDSVVENYRKQRLEQEFDAGKNRLTDSVQVNNFEILKNYNDSVVKAVNDSIYLILDEFIEYADFIDTTRLRMTNLVGDESSVLLQNDNQYFSRVWLKNEQNDSMKVMVKNLDKRTIQLLIDDGVTFNRFTTKETKEFDFKSLNRDITGFSGVGQKYQVLTPWRIGGDGSVGFTQTYIENWKKGGQSALSLLMVLKGFANYSNSDGKVKWANSAEFRNGYIRPGGKESQLRKNDDKFEITSRLGLSAFKKWYYSTEFNYETQIFNGYNYPKTDESEPISAFMAPARTFFKIGLDYKPNNNFSLFLAPLTLKNVYVRDTIKIDQTKFGIEEGKKGFWLPGLNADLSYRKNFTPDISYETKYKMFVNFRAPFSKFDVNWENQVVIRLNDHVNMRLFVHMIYDDDVKFPIENDLGEVIGEKAKVQLKEFFTIGFSYKINRQVTRTRRN